MSVLADSSIWIDYLRHGPRGVGARLDSLIATNDLLVCGPVVAELLAGASGQTSEGVWQSLAGLPWAELSRDDWRAVGVVAARLHAIGRPAALTDIEIAVAARGAEAMLWTHDEDFDRIGDALGGLRRYEP